MLRPQNPVNDHDKKESCCQCRQRIQTHRKLRTDRAGIVHQIKRKLRDCSRSEEPSEIFSPVCRVKEALHNAKDKNRKGLPSDSPQNPVQPVQEIGRNRQHQAGARLHRSLKKNNRRMIHQHRDHGDPFQNCLAHTSSRKLSVFQLPLL